MSAPIPPYISTTLYPKPNVPVLSSSTLTLNTQTPSTLTLNTQTLSQVNLLWNQKADEIKQASTSAVDLQRKMSIEDCERWSIRKRDQMTQMRERVAARAKSMGCALEGTRSACVTTPGQLRDFDSPMFLLKPVQEEGGHNGTTQKMRVVRAVA